MRTPRTELDIQTGCGEIVTGSVVARAPKLVVQAPQVSGNVIPVDADPRLGRFGAQVHHNQISLFASIPSPRHEALVAVVVGPTGLLAERPAAVAKRVARRD